MARFGEVQLGDQWTAKVGGRIVHVTVIDMRLQTVRNKLCRRFQLRSNRTGKALPKPRTAAFLRELQQRTGKCPRCARDPVDLKRTARDQRLLCQRCIGSLAKFQNEKKPIGHIKDHTCSHCGLRYALQVPRYQIGLDDDPNVTVRRICSRCIDHFRRYCSRTIIGPLRVAEESA